MGYSSRRNILILVVLIFGHDRFRCVNEIKVISHFYKHLDKPVTQCFTLRGMSCSVGRGRVNTAKSVVIFEDFHKTTPFFLCFSNWSK